MGNMEPTATEVEGPLVPIHGALPTDIDGHFIRNGPNPALNLEGDPTYHEFAGDGMLHSADLKAGVGIYKNRWIRTERLELEGKLGRTLQREEVVADGRYKGLANTAIVYYRNQLLALYEVDKPYVVSMADLETQGQLDFGGKLKHAMTAHPKVCPKTGELFFFNYELMQPVVHYGVADRDGNLTTHMAVPTQGKKPVMIHDMAITEKYALLLEFPLYFSLDRAKQGKMPYFHDQSLPAKFGIVPRHARSPDEIRWFEAETAVNFHIGNAWEEGSKVKLIACPQRNFSFEYEESAPSLLTEYSFDLDTGKTTERLIDPDTKMEFPVNHPKLVGDKIRYVWCAAFTDKPAKPYHGVNGCIKYDLATGERIRHDFLDGRWGGESAYVPRLGASNEDDGYLLNYTYNPKDKTTELYVVDAKTMDPSPVAILRTPQRVPFGFHATWVPRSAT